MTADVLQLALELVEWLKNWAHQGSPIALCYFAYRNFKSKCMRQIVRLSKTPSSGTKDGVQHLFELSIYYIQRLRFYYLAAATMVSYGRRLPGIFKNYRVEGIIAPHEVGLPPFVVSTNLDSRCHSHVLSRVSCP
jgi:hypothetical protein